MIELNLLPPEFRRREAPKLTLPELPIKKTLITFFGVFIAIQVLFSAFAIYQRIEFASIKQQTAALTQETLQIAKEKKEMAAERKRLTKINGLIQRNFYWTSVLNALSSSMTKGVWLTHLSVADEKRDDKNKTEAQKKEAGSSREGIQVKVLRIDGSAVGQGEETAFVGKFIKELKSNPLFSDLFSDIDLFRIEQKKIRDFDVYDFSLSCIFKNEKVESAS